MNNLTTRQRTRRAATILRSALSDQPVKPVLIARLTVTHQNGVRTIVELHQGATFHSFYHYFSQTGARRSTKTALRTASRNEGVSWAGFEPLYPVGLETIARKLEKYAALVNPVVSTKLRIIRRKAYRRLLKISPDQLGLTQMGRGIIYNPAHS